MRAIKVCLHVPSPCPPCPSSSLSQFNIVSMVMDRLTDRLGSEHILSVNVTLTKMQMVTGTETVCVNGQ